MLGDNRVACAIQFTACASWCAGGMCVSPAQLGRCLPHGMGWESNSPPFLIINRDGTVDPGTHRSASARDATARPRQPDRRRRVSHAHPVPSAAVASIHPRTPSGDARRKFKAAPCRRRRRLRRPPSPGGRGPNHRACVAVLLRCVNNSIPSWLDAPTTWPP